MASLSSQDRLHGKGPVEQSVRIRREALRDRLFRNSTVLGDGALMSGAALRGEVEHEELQNLIAGGQVELESPLKGGV